MSLRPMTADERSEMEMGRLMKRLAANPKTRRPVLNAIRVLDPQARFADQDVQDLREELARKDAQRAAQLNAAIERTRMETQRKSLGSRYKEEQIKEIETLMQTHGILDYDIGAKLYAADLPPPVPVHQTNSRGGPWTLPDDKELLNNPREWANKQAQAVIGEFIAARQK